MNDSVIVEFKGVFFGMIWVRISDPILDQWSSISQIMVYYF